MDARAPALVVAALSLACIATTACTSRTDRAPAGADASGTGSGDTLVLFVAASLTRPLQPLTDSLARAGTTVQRESGASLEHARKITELGRIPDAIALADYEIFPNLLFPRYTSWYAEFARNRMVIAFTDRSRYASRIDSTNWTRILARPDVQVGRTDPDVAPVGYRTLLLLSLANRYYHDATLSARLLANAPRANMRGDAAQLAALLATGELDYIYDYESVAVSHGFRYIALPAAIDLSDPARASEYAAVSVRVRGQSSGDSVTIHGQPILYALSVPEHAPHRRAGERFIALLLGPEGRAALRASHVDALDHAIIIGNDVPAPIRVAAQR